MPGHVSISLLGATVSYLIVGAIRRWAESQQLLDIPNERSSHLKPVARGGGIAIVVITLVGLVLFGSFDRSFGAVVLGATLIAGLSWWDDVRSLPGTIRLVVHSAAALLALAALGWWSRIDLPWVGPVELGWLGGPLTLLWIVGLTNAYNFMDGIDGIAGGQAMVASIGWIFLGTFASLPLATLIGLLIASSTLGFLLHNWPPARIFMGDVGSAFLGYLFAILPLLGGRRNSSLALCGILVVWPFVFDTSFTFFRRLRRREKIFSAHRSHLYQRLVISGLSHQTVTLIYIGLAGIGVGAAVAFLRGSGEIATILAVSVVALILWLGVIYREHSTVPVRSSPAA